MEVLQLLLPTLVENKGQIQIFGLVIPNTNTITNICHTLNDSQLTFFIVLELMVDGTFPVRAPQTPLPPLKVYKSPSTITRVSEGLVKLSTTSSSILYL